MVVVEVVFLTFFWTWVACALVFLRNTIPPPSSLTANPEQLGLPSQTVRFQATDGLQLEGWMIRSDPARPWIILCHGAGTNRTDLLDLAAGLHAERFNLLVFDFRGHGGSAGRTTSFGWTEQRDVEGALTFLGQHPEVADQPYGIYGVSMGGAVALMVAARDERLGAIAVDRPYTNLEAALAHTIRLTYRLPAAPFLWCVLATYRLRFGVWPRRVSPDAVVSQLAPRPLWLVQGGAASRVPMKTIQTRCARASQPTTLWVSSGAGHLEAFNVDPKGYLTRLARFFDSALA